MKYEFVFKKILVFVIYIFKINHTFFNFRQNMDDGGINNMEQDSLSNLTLTESELLNLQQAGVLVTNPSTHFSQTDFDTLASIQAFVWLECTFMKMIVCKFYA